MSREMARRDYESACWRLFCEAHGKHADCPTRVAIALWMDAYREARAEYSAEQVQMFYCNTKTYFDAMWRKYGRKIKKTLADMQAKAAIDARA